PAYETKKAVYDAKKGRRGRAPKPPDENPMVVLRCVQICSLDAVLEGGCSSISEFASPRAM
ncbi:hypothetical protein, partial [Acidisoma sp. S159]|uniref:hypothetical protein n=1 Tax=Acidisoma sp. S159 TaxID=1747225 RepID=UPI001C20B02C